MKKLASLLAAGSVLLASAPVAGAGAISRTFNAYDLTQCVCTYGPLSTESYIQSWPKVIASSYYDSTITASTSPYTEYYSVNSWHAYNGSGSLAKKAVWTLSGEVAYVICWATADSGAYMDKVAVKLTVNDIYAWFIFYIPDQYVHDWVAQSGHHC